MRVLLAFLKCHRSTNGLLTHPSQATDPSLGLDFDGFALLVFYSPGPALDIGDWGSRREADWRLEIGPGRLEIGLWAPGGFFYSRRGVADRRRGFREELLDVTCSCLSIVPFDTGPKRSMGHLLGAEKNNFFNSQLNSRY